MRWTAKGVQVLRGTGGPVLVIPAPHTEDINRIKLDGEYSIELKRASKKRSLNANSYCWLLCQRIAETLSRDGQYASKEEVYRAAIQDSQAFIPVCVQEKVVKDVVKDWEHHGVGWVAVDTGVSKVKTCTVLHFYAGSSTYDTQEMGRLIDCLVNMAREQGVALESDEYIDALVAEWEGVKED